MLLLKSSIDRRIQYFSTILLSLAKQCDPFIENTTIFNTTQKKPPINIHKPCINAQLANVMLGSYKLDIPFIGGGFGRIKGNKSATCHGNPKMLLC